jgi:hypothetical protein
VYEVNDERDMPLSLEQLGDMGASFQPETEPDRQD